MKGLSNPSVRLALFALVCALGVGAALAALGQRTALHETGALLRGEQIADSWRPMIVAHDYVVRDPAKPLYDWIFFERRIKFIYPPTSLLIVDALEWLPRQRWGAAVNLLSWFSLLVTAGFSLAILERGLRDRGVASDLGERAARAGAVTLLALTFYPMVKAYTLGQAQVLVNAFAAAALWCWMTDRRRAAGVLVALMGAIKPQYALIGLWGLFRREGSFVVAGALTGLALLGASFAAYGIAHHAGYLDVVAHVSRLGEAYHANQSVNGLLHRWLGTMQSAVWDPQEYPPYHPIVYFGTLASSLALLGVAFFGPLRHRDRGRGGGIDFAAALLATTLASPIAWEHHYGVLLPIGALLLAALWTQPAALWALAAVWIVASHYFPATEALDMPLGVTQSSLLFAALSVLALLLSREAVPPSPSEHTVP